MKPSRIALIIFSVIIAYNITLAQVFRPFPEGLGVEFGGGYNQLRWHINPSPFSSERDFARQAFSLAPTVRLKYAIHPNDRIELTPIIGYNRFGGKSAEQSDGYKDEIWFDVFEVGLIGSYDFESWNLGGGIKYNHHNNIYQRHFGSVGQLSNRTWEEDDFAWFFRGDSYHLGLRVSRSYGQFSVSAESWFGITQLEADGFNDAVNIHNNHFYILVGYSL